MVSGEMRRGRRRQYERKKVMRLEAVTQIRRAASVSMLRLSPQSPVLISRRIGPGPKRAKVECGSSGSGSGGGGGGGRQNP